MHETEMPSPTTPRPKGFILLGRNIAIDVKTDRRKDD
jgi:hypothetical protein